MGIQSCGTLVTTWVVAWANVQLQYCKSLNWVLYSLSVLELSAVQSLSHWIECAVQSVELLRYLREGLLPYMNLHHIIVQSVIATRSYCILLLPHHSLQECYDCHFIRSISNWHILCTPSHLILSWLACTNSWCPPIVYCNVRTSTVSQSLNWLLHRTTCNCH